MSVASKKRLADSKASKHDDEFEGGSSSRPDTGGVKKRNWTEWLVQYASLAVVGYLVIPPIGMLIYGSFRTESPFVPGEWTLDNYVAVVTDKVYLDAMINTVWIAGCVAVLATCMGTVLAWTVYRTNMPLKRTLTLLITASFFFPSFISAMAWAILGSPKAGLLTELLRPLGIHLNMYSLTGIIVVMTISYLPYAFLFTTGPFQALDPSLEESAKLAGASEARVFFSITLPLVRYSVLSAGLLVFVSSLGVFGVPAILGTPAGEWVLATRLWSLTRFYPANHPMAAAIGISLVVITVLALLLQRKFLAKRQYTTITARGYRPSTIDLGKWRFGALAVCLAYVALGVVIPVVTIAFRSLVPFISPGEPLTFSFDAYHRVLTEYPVTMRAFKNSLILSGGGGLIGLTLCTIVAYLIVKSRMKSRRVLDVVSTIPVAVPGLVIGAGLVWAYLTFPIGIYGTLWILMLSYVTRYIPYGVATISSNLVQLDDALEEAAYVSGATWLRMMWDVILPLLRPALLATYVILFVDFFKELSSAILLYTHGNEVISVAIWDLYDASEWGMASALALMALVVVYGLLGLVFAFDPKAITRSKD